MSRGHGKWERAILAALDRVQAFYLTDLLPTPHTRSHVVALNRAARNLVGVGKIEKWTWMSKRSTDHGFVSVHRVGYPVREREQITRLNVASSVQHLISPV
jgi:hypothetical protein